jgi:hypothetical protein
MTTIAYRDGVMAADSGCWMGAASHGWAEKVARAPDGSLYGVTGDAAECETYPDWVREGASGDHPAPRRLGVDGNSFLVLIARPCGLIEIIASGGIERYRGAPYFAVGSGAATAFGALFMGATAEQAIEAAKEHGEGAFGAVRTVRRDG